MKIGVVGASGYSGGELLRLLSSHPHFQVGYIAAGSQAGASITSVHPQLVNYADRAFEATEISQMNKCELLFFALPHGESAKLITEVDSKIKIVDLGADFRLESPTSWDKYYGGEYAGAWVYGLPEIPGQREKISSASRVANPGCYATAIALATAPALYSKIIDGSDIVVVAASGTTGAGRKASINLLGSEIMGSLTSYKFGGVHQHTPEIEQTLSSLGDGDVKISFTPILAPMPRGILATVTAKLKSNLKTADVQEIYRDFYNGEEFVSVLASNQLPKTSAVLGSNSAQIQVAVDEHTNRIVISAVIDNLGKGAASQAIQNANLISGFPENAGLSSQGIGS
jgi:N-acetyl-gamma-glutamyl-phosphate reductase